MVDVKIDMTAACTTCTHAMLACHNLNSIPGAHLDWPAQARPGPPIAHVELQSRETKLMRKTPAGSGRLHVSRFQSQFYSGAVALIVGPPYLNETGEVTVSFYCPSTCGIDVKGGSISKKRKSKEKRKRGRKGEGETKATYMT